MISRRKFAQLLGASAGATALGRVNRAQAQGTPVNIPRNRTLIAPWNVNGPVFRNVGLANPFSINIQDIRGSVLNAFEAMFYYSIEQDKLISWLGESYEYLDDHTALQIKLRKGVEWSDGTPFTARDVAFTYNMLRDVGKTTRDLQHSTEVADSVREAIAVDDLTVRINFTGRNLRFVENLLLHYVDVGFPVVPEHIWKDVEDYASFTFYDPEKGWPVVTGPWRVTRFTDTQTFLDRRDDWWAAKTGFHPLPEVERFIGVPSGGTDQPAQLLVTNQIDLANTSSTDVVTSAKARNPNLITFDDEPPYGETVSWAPALFFNHKLEKWSDVNLRRAVNFYLDRNQLVANFSAGSDPSFGPFASLGTMKAVNEVVRPLAQKHGIGIFDPAKGDDLMQSAGFTKNGEGFWEKDGRVLDALIEGITAVNQLGPLVAQQLRNAGIDARFRSTPESRATMRDGNFDLTVFGHVTSDLDPFVTLENYHSKNAVEIGQPTLLPARWSNAKYDRLVEEAEQHQSTDPRFVELAGQAMDIWMEEAVEAPLINWYAQTIMNTTCWTNWPTEADPYMTTPSHRLSGSFAYVLNKLKATQ